MIPLQRPCVLLEDMTLIPSIALSAVSDLQSKLELVMLEAESSDPLSDSTPLQRITPQMTTNRYSRWLLLFANLYKAIFDAQISWFRDRRNLHERVQTVYATFSTAKFGDGRGQACRPMGFNLQYCGQSCGVWCLFGGQRWNTTLLPNGPRTGSTRASGGAHKPRAFARPWLSIARTPMEHPSRASIPYIGRTTNPCCLVCCSGNLKPVISAHIRTQPWLR